MSIKQKFTSSAGWMVLGTGADNLIQFVIFAVLARVLSIRDLGIVAFAMVLIEIGRIFVNSGLSEATVQRAEWDDKVGSVCFTANLLLATFFAFLLAGVGAPLLETYYARGSGLPVAILSLMFILEASRSIHGAKLRREFRYRNLAVRGTVSGIIAGTGAVYLAYSGWGIWALIFQRLCFQVITTLMTWQAARWTPRFSLSLPILREIAPFSIRVTMSRALEAINLRIPDLSLGLLFGPEAVAIYRVGARGLEAITKIAIQPFQDAAFAAFSRVGDKAAIGNAFRRVLRAAAFVTFPVFLGATTLAQELTVLLFGAKYASSGTVMAILALGALPGTIMFFTTSAYLAAGEARAGMRANLASVIGNTAFSSALGATFGAPGAAIGNALSQSLVMPLNLMLLRQYLGLQISKVLASVGPPFFAAAAMAAVLWALKLWLLGGLPIFARFLAIGVSGALLYPLLLLIAGRRFLFELIDDIAPLLPRLIRSLVSRKPNPSTATPTPGVQPNDEIVRPAVAEPLPGNEPTI